MMTPRPLLLFAFFLLGTSEILISQENTTVPSCIRREIIQIFDTVSGYQSDVTLQSTPIKDHKCYYISYSSLEKVTDYETRYYSEKGKWKMFRKGDRRDFQAPTDVFYSCQRILSLELPEKLPFQVNFTMKSPELFTQSHLLFFCNFPVDTFYYEIKVPKYYHFHYQLIYPEKLKYFKSDSMVGKHEIIYYITGIPKVKGPENNENTQTNVRQHKCLALTIITPKEYAGSETQYFNEFMLKKIQSKTPLDNQSKALIDSITGTINDQDSIMFTVFNYIRDHIKYIAVEIGYGAFIPHDVNKTLKNRQGDCKDMASLLCQALCYKGIDARLAVSSTNTQMVDMTFPSLAAGNHMICVVKKDTSWRFLDATDKTGSCWLPSWAIQGRTVLILGTENGLFQPVAASEPEINREHFSLNLKFENDSLTGSVRYVASGAVMQHLRSYFESTPQSEWPVLSSKILSSLIESASFNQTAITQTNDSSVITARTVLSPSLFTKNGQVAYLALGFLPSPMTFIHCDGIKGDIVLGYKVFRDVDVLIDMDQPYQNIILKPIRYDQDGFQYYVTATDNNGQLNIRSFFRCDKLQISEDEFPAYQKFNTFISTTLRNAITLR